MRAKSVANCVLRQLIVLVLRAQTVEVVVVIVLAGLGQDNGRHKPVLTPPISPPGRCFNPDGNVDGDVEEQA